MCGTVSYEAALYRECTIYARKGPSQNLNNSTKGREVLLDSVASEFLLGSVADEVLLGSVTGEVFLGCR